MVISPLYRDIIASLVINCGQCVRDFDLNGGIFGLFCYLHCKCILINLHKLFNGCVESNRNIEILKGGFGRKSPISTEGRAY